MQCSWHTLIFSKLILSTGRISRAGSCAIDFQTKSVLALKKNVKWIGNFSFLFSTKILSVWKSIAHDPAINLKKLRNLVKIITRCLLGYRKFQIGMWLGRQFKLQINFLKSTPPNTTDASVDYCLLFVSGQRKDMSTEMYGMTFQLIITLKMIQHL